MIMKNVYNFINALALLIKYTEWSELGYIW